MTTSYLYLGLDDKLVVAVDDVVSCWCSPFNCDNNEECSHQGRHTPHPMTNMNDEREMGEMPVAKILPMVKL